MYYFECGEIINCRVYSSKIQGNWSTNFNCFGERDTIMILPRSYRNTIFFFMIGRTAQLVLLIVYALIFHISIHLIEIV